LCSTMLPVVCKLAEVVTCLTCSIKLAVG
jgi:hypothetical protein